MFVQTWLAGGSHSSIVAYLFSQWVKGSCSPTRYLSLENASADICLFGVELFRFQPSQLQRSSSFRFCSAGSFPSASECWQKRICVGVCANSRGIPEDSAAHSRLAPAARPVESGRFR